LHKVALTASSHTETIMMENKGEREKKGKEREEKLEKMKK
jgi:hypothetical protein